MTGKSLMFRAVLGPLCCLYHNQRDAVYQLDSSQLESFYSPDEFSLDRLHNQGRTRAWLCDDIDDISGLPFTLFCPMLGERVIHLRLGSPARVIEPKDFPPGQFASNVDPQGYISTKLGHTSLMRRIIPFHYARPIPQALANEIALALPEEMDSILQKGKLAYKEALAHNSFSS